MRLEGSELNSFADYFLYSGSEVGLAAAATEWEQVATVEPGTIITSCLLSILLLFLVHWTG